MMMNPVLTALRKQRQDTAERPAVGCKEISDKCFGGALDVRQVNSLAVKGGWPFFKIGHLWAGLPSAFKAEMQRRAHLEQARGNGEA